MELLLIGAGGALIYCALGALILCWHGMNQPTFVTLQARSTAAAFVMIVVAWPIVCPVFFVLSDQVHDDEPEIEDPHTRMYTQQPR